MSIKYPEISHVHTSDLCDVSAISLPKSTVTSLSSPGIQQPQLSGTHFRNRAYITAFQTLKRISWVPLRHHLSGLGGRGIDLCIKKKNPPEDCDVEPG